jgi:hypothetical protein
MPAKKNVVDMSAVEKVLPDYFTIGEGGKVHSSCCAKVKSYYKAQRGDNKTDFAKQVATKASKPAAGSTDMCGHCTKIDGKN